MMAKQLNIKRFFKTPGQAIPTDENNNHASEIHVQEDELDVAPENGKNEKAESGLV